MNRIVGYSISSSEIEIKDITQGWGKGKISAPIELYPEGQNWELCVEGRRNFLTTNALYALYDERLTDREILMLFIAKYMAAQEGITIYRELTPRAYDGEQCVGATPRYALTEENLLLKSLIKDIKEGYEPQLRANFYESGDISLQFFSHTYDPFESIIGNALSNTNALEFQRAIEDKIEGNFYEFIQRERRVREGKRPTEYNYEEARAICANEKMNIEHENDRVRKAIDSSMDLAENVLFYPWKADDWALDTIRSTALADAIKFEIIPTSFEKKVRTDSYDGEFHEGEEITAYKLEITNSELFGTEVDNYSTIVRPKYGEALYGMDGLGDIKPFCVSSTAHKRAIENVRQLKDIQSLCWLLYDHSVIDNKFEKRTDGAIELNVTEDIAENRNQSEIRCFYGDIDLEDFLIQRTESDYQHLSDEEAYDLYENGEFILKVEVADGIKVAAELRNGDVSVTIDEKTFDCPYVKTKVEQRTKQQPQIERD